MDLLDNSFHLLDATPRDNRSHLMALAEDKSLIDESEAVNTARAELTNPRKRLASEVSWLPGMGPKQVNAAIKILQNKPASLLELLENNTFNILKHGSIIINTSRPSAIDEETLYCALKTGNVAAAGLDVFGKEPYDGKLIEMDNVVLTPHIGSYAREARIDMEITAVNNLVNSLKDVL